MPSGSRITRRSAPVSIRRPAIPHIHADVNTVAAANPHASRTGPIAWIVLAQAAALVSLVPWAVVAGLSFLSFSSGAAGGALLPVGLLFALWAYPLLPLACGVAAWRAFRRGGVRAAVRWSGVQLLGAALVLALVGFLISPVG